jgi:hypothetical protein
MSLSWLPSTSSGVMVGDYTAVAFSNGRAYAVFAVARANSGTTFDEAIYANTNALSITASQLARTAMRATNAVTRNSDHGPRKFYDLDHEHPIQPPKKK